MEVPHKVPEGVRYSSDIKSEIVDVRTFFKYAGKNLIITFKYINNIFFFLFIFFKVVSNKHFRKSKRKKPND